jgi:tRNA pseudouridine55 synthase
MPTDPVARMTNAPFEAVDGVLLLDKPVGASSNAALQRARRLLNARKAGHTGTLDPLAEGLLALTFGEATKFSGDLLDADKCYEARLALGTVTATGDAEGQVVERRPVDVRRDAFEAALARFTGTVLQVPPMHSALKRDGQPLYRLARQGIEVERRARPVAVRRLWTIAWDALTPTIGVECGKGLYVRTLAEDIGAALGCGAHLDALRRTRIGPFDVSSSIGLDRLEALPIEARRRQLLPIDALLQSLPRVDLDRQASEELAHGRQVAWGAGSAQRARVYGPQGRLLGVATVDHGVLVARRLLSRPQPLESER